MTADRAPASRGRAGPSSDSRVSSRIHLDVAAIRIVNRDGCAHAKGPHSQTVRAFRICSPTSPLPAHRHPHPGHRDHTWLDDCTRYALHVSAHRAITTPIVTATSAKPQVNTAPRIDLTDNGMVYTVRLAGRPPGGRTARATTPHLARRPEELPTQPPHHLRQGRALQQTMKKWLRAQPDQPATIAELQELLDQFMTSTTSTGRTAPCRTGPHRQRSTTPCPRPSQGPSRDTETHDRIRHDRVDRSGTVTLRVAGQLRHIGIGRTHTGTHVILLSRTSTSASSTPSPASSSATHHRPRPATTNPQHPEMTNNRTHVSEGSDVTMS